MAILKLTTRFIRILLRLQKARLSEVEMDQSLLFEGSDVKLIWVADHCMFVKVQVQGLKCKYLHSSGYAVIPLFRGLSITITAYGAFNSVRYCLKPVIHPLGFNLPGNDQLYISSPSHPSMIGKLETNLPLPLIFEPEINMRSPNLTQGITILDLSSEKLLAEMLLV